MLGLPVPLLLKVEAAFSAASKATDVAASAESISWAAGHTTRRKLQHIGEADKRPIAA